MFRTHTSDLPHPLGEGVGAFILHLYQSLIEGCSGSIHSPAQLACAVLRGSLWAAVGPSKGLWEVTSRVCYGRDPKRNSNSQAPHPRSMRSVIGLESVFFHKFSQKYLLHLIPLNSTSPTFSLLLSNSSTSHALCGQGQIKILKFIGIENLPQLIHKSMWNNTKQ